MIKTKLLVLAVFSTLLYPCIGFAQLAADSFRQAKATKEASLIYVYNNEVGCAARDDQGNVNGMLVDLMREFENYVQEKYGIASQIKFELIDNQDFSSFMQTVKGGSGGVFGLSYTSINPERQQTYQFSQPFMNSVLILITREGSDMLESLDEIETKFKSKTAYTIPSSSYSARLDQIRKDYFSSMNIVNVKSETEMINKVSADQNGFAVIDLLHYLEFYKKGIRVMRHKVGDQAGDQFGIIMPKASDWKPVLDEFFNSGFIKSAEYRKIVSKHLGKGALRLVE